MLALARRKKINLPTPRCERTGVPTAYSEQKELCYIAKIEADAATIRAAVLADFVPDEIGFVRETSRLHHSDTFRQ